MTDSETPKTPETPEPTFLSLAVGKTIDQMRAIEKKLPELHRLLRDLQEGAPSACLPVGTPPTIPVEIYYRNAGLDVIDEDGETLVSGLQYCLTTNTILELLYWFRAGMERGRREGRARAEAELGRSMRVLLAPAIAEAVKPLTNEMAGASDWIIKGTR